MSSAFWVYEFMPRGSLENHLFSRGSYFQPLSWTLRMKVALGAAKGLAFLHSAETRMIYRDFKTSNILLDSRISCLNKICSWNQLQNRQWAIQDGNARVYPENCPDDEK